MTNSEQNSSDVYGRHLPLEIKRAIARVYDPRRPPIIFPAGVVEGRPQKLKLFDMAAQVIGDGTVTYLEFGVYKGWSINQIAQRFQATDARFFGFDSFEGLPEPWSVLEVGHFATGGDAPSTRDGRIDFVKGWFQESLPQFLRTRQISTPVLINFDADLYSSTLFLLSTIWQYIPEYFFFFDEFIGDEMNALHDFSRAFPVDFEFLGATEGERDWPHQVFGHMKNRPLRPNVAPT